jgi:two-component system sensor histidine kinase KdpD
LDDHELSIAQWTFSHGQTAGHGTNTLPSTAVRFLPLSTAGGTVGVLAVAAPAGQRSYLPRQELLLEAFASLAALGVERVRLAEKAARLEAVAAAERLQEALLHSVSHDLRTPLASVTGVLSSLRDDAESPEPCLDRAARAELTETALEQAERLNRLVGNLLDIARLETGAVRANTAACDVTEVVGSVLGRFEPALSEREVRVSIPLETPPMAADFVLLAQALSNIVDNALKYSPPGSPVEIEASAAREGVVLSVADSGPGVDADDLPRVFDRFYRGRDVPAGTGSGLGLAIARGFIEAQGGSVELAAREPAGTVVRIAMPAARHEGATGV